MRRREFLAKALGVASISPLAAFGQPTSRVAKVGHLESGFPSTAPNLLAAFRQGLRDLGYVDGQNLFIVSRYGEGREERLRPLADELVQYGVDVIFAIGPPQAVAVAKATDKIPIVFVGGGDPVQMGLVKSLAHPSGNATGLTFVTVDLASKRIQLLKEAIPSSKRVAILWNPDNTINHLELAEATKTAEALKLTSLPVEIRVLDDIDGAFAGMASQSVDAVLVLSSPLTFPNRPRRAFIHHQQLIKLVAPRPHLRKRLRFALVAELRHFRTDDLLYHLPGHPELTADWIGRAVGRSR